MTAAQILTAALTAASPAPKDGTTLEPTPIVEQAPALTSASLASGYREMSAKEIAEMQQQSSGASTPASIKSSAAVGQSTSQSPEADKLSSENTTLHKLLLKLDPALVDQVPAENNAQLKLIGRLMSGPNALSTEQDQNAVNAALKTVIGSSVVTQDALDAAMDNAGLKSAERNLVADVRGSGASVTSGSASTETSAGVAAPIAVSKEQRAKENILLAGLVSDVVGNLSKEEREAYKAKPEWDAVEKAKDYGKLEKLKEQDVNKHYTEITTLVKDLDQKHPERVDIALNGRTASEKESLSYLMRESHIRSREIALERQEQRNERNEQERQQDADRHRQRMETTDHKQSQAKIKDNMKRVNEGLKIITGIKKTFGL